jgi:hypothetical protein
MIQRNWDQPHQRPQGFGSATQFRIRPDGFALARFPENAGWVLYGPGAKPIVSFGRTDTPVSEAITLADAVLSGVCGCGTLEALSRLGPIANGETLFAVQRDVTGLPAVRDVLVMEAGGAIRGFINVRGLHGPQISEAKPKQLYRDKREATIAAAQQCAAESEKFTKRRDELLDGIEYTPAEELAGLDRVLSAVAPADSFRREMTGLASAVVSELSRDDFEGCTVRENVLKMNDPLKE